MASCVRELITANAEPFVHEDESALEAARRLVEHPAGGLAVRGSDNRLKRIITGNDLLHVLLDQSGLSNARVRDVPGKALGIGADATLEEALEQMKHRGVARLAVVEGQDVLGIIRRADVIEALVKRGQKALERERALLAMHRQKLGLISRISPRDSLYTGDENDYFATGISTVECIRLAMDAVGKGGVAKILDLPCGYGRELRVLKPAFPEARITACDIDQDAVDFCAETFGVAPLYSHEDPELIIVDGAFDLIWCGSLLTHLDQARWTGFLRLFDSLLSPDGLLLFTTHGRWYAQLLASGEHMGLEPDPVIRMLEDYRHTGFGYANYPHGERYGVSLSSPAWVCRQLERWDLLIVGMRERGWGWDLHSAGPAYQDVIACAKEPP